MTTIHPVAERHAAAPIVLTADAAAKVAELLAAENDDALSLRIAVRAGGCSGFSYEIFFDSAAAPNDHVAVFGPVTVRVDSASVPLLAGATLRYSDGLQGAGFSIDNPNAQRSCGCGKSFS